MQKETHALKDTYWSIATPVCGNSVLYYLHWYPENWKTADTVHF